MWEVKRDFHCSGETAVSDRETGNMFVSAGSAACFWQCSMQESRGIERGLIGIGYGTDRIQMIEKEDKNGKQACVACFF